MLWKKQMGADREMRSEKGTGCSQGLDTLVTASLMPSKSCNHNMSWFSELRFSWCCQNGSLYLRLLLAIFVTSRPVTWIWCNKGWLWLRNVQHARLMSFFFFWCDLSLIGSHLLIFSKIIVLWKLSSMNLNTGYMPSGLFVAGTKLKF